MPNAKRFFLALNLKGATTEQAGRALLLEHFAASQRVRRKGFTLLPPRAESEAREEAERIQGCGLRVFLVPEEEVREAQTPVPVLRGRLSGRTLELSGAVRVEIRAEELLLVVTGPITRTRQTSEKLKKLESPLEGGVRLHLHRRSERKPVEVDPGDFALSDSSLPGSTLLEVLGWLKEVAPDAPRDDGFRLESPALSPEVSSEGITQLVQGLQGGGGKDRPVILDNLPQFRFYSAWRAAVQRRIEGG
jgi:hypothetical protein